jgi:hypothetical protein
VVLVIAVVAAMAFLMSRESAIDIRTAETAAEVDAARYVAEAGLRHALWKANTDACTGYGLSATSFGPHSYQAAFAPDNGSPVSVSVTGTLASGAQWTFNRSGVRVNQSTQALVLQPDGTDGKDARVYQWKPTWNYGESVNMMVGDRFSDSLSRGLIRFDLSEIPPGARITGAMLELYQASPSSWGGTVYVHRLTRDWVEGDGTGSGGSGVTWVESEPGIPWTVPGGDFDPYQFAVATIPVGVLGWFQWDVTQLAEEWHSGAHPNHGLLLKPAGGSTEVFFGTSDGTVGERPKLTVTYACECGKVCVPPPSCDADFPPDTVVGEFSTAGQSYDYLGGITYFPQGKSINGTPAPAGGGWLTVGTSGRLVLLDMTGNILDDGFDTALSNLEGVTYVYAGLKAGRLAMVSGSTLYYSDPTVLPPSTSYSTHVIPFVSDAKGISYIDGGSYDGHLAVADGADDRIRIFDQSLNLVLTLASESILNGPEGIAHLRATDKFLVAEKNQKRAVVMDTALNVTQIYDLAPFGWGTPSAAAIHPLSCDHVLSDLNNDRYRSLNDSALGAVEIRVASSSDDAEELMTTNDVDLTSADLQLTEDLGVAQTVGMRFDNVGVPPGATITSAWIQFQTAATNTGAVNLTLRGEAADDAAPFAAAAADISSRPPTAASVPWSPGNWQTLGEAGANQQTPDIASLIQEIVDRPGWLPGNALVVLVSGSGVRTAESFDGDPAGAPLLHIEY